MPEVHPLFVIAAIWILIDILVVLVMLRWGERREAADRAAERQPEPDYADEPQQLEDRQ